MSGTEDIVRNVADRTPAEEEVGIGRRNMGGKTERKIFDGNRRCLQPERADFAD